MRAPLILLTVCAITHALTPAQLLELQRFGRLGRSLPVTSLDTTNYPGPEVAGNQNYGSVLSRYSFGPNGVPLNPNPGPFAAVDNLLGSALGTLGSLASGFGNVQGGVRGFGGQLGLGNIGGGFGGFGGFGGYGGFGGAGGFGGMPNIPFVPNFLDGLMPNIPITNGHGGSISSVVPIGENGHAETNVGAGFGYGKTDNAIGFGSSFGGSFTFDTSKPASSPPQAAFTDMNGQPVMSLNTPDTVTSKYSGRMATDAHTDSTGTWDDWFRHK